VEDTETGKALLAAQVEPAEQARCQSASYLFFAGIDDAVRRDGVRRPPIM